jgi:hypothetical protein
MNPHPCLMVLQHTTYHLSVLVDWPRPLWIKVRSV